MSHFAKVDNNNRVTEVIVADQEFINSGMVGDAYQWIQTSYNGSFRKNFAGTGFIYDVVRNAFIEPSPFDSWVLNEETCTYSAPVDYPTDDNRYEWDEETTNWITSE